MKKVIKAIMYVFRENNGKKEFFILHRKRGDVVTLTGHVGDTIQNESIKDAAKRETKEELGVNPKSILDLKTKTLVNLRLNGENIVSEEHAFLIEIPNKEVCFLEADEKHNWHSIDELYDVLTYENQKTPLDEIKKKLNSPK